MLIGRYEGDLWTRDILDRMHLVLRAARAVARDGASLPTGTPDGQERWTIPIPDVDQPADLFVQTDEDSIVLGFEPGTGRGPIHSDDIRVDISCGSPPKEFRKRLEWACNTALGTVEALIATPSCREGRNAAVAEAGRRALLLSASIGRAVLVRMPTCSTPAFLERMPGSPTGDRMDDELDDEQREIIESLPQAIDVDLTLDMWMTDVAIRFHRIECDATTDPLEALRMLGEWRSGKTVRD